MTNAERIEQIVLSQRNFYNSGATQDYKERIIQLEKLEAMILVHETEICKALFEDLHKSANESRMTEISLVLSEIKYHKRHLKRWIKPQGVPFSLFSLLGKSYIQYQPLGITLIIAPWNYPVLLLLSPLIGAISAGNCVVLKPAPQAVNTSALLAKLINEYFPEKYIALFEGHSDINQILLAQPFDYIFFTGGAGFGQYVATTAAQRLIPYTLELGGKSPCIVSKHADIELAAKRIVWGKFLNAGQTCIAPDYLLVENSVRSKLIDKIIQYIIRFFTDNPEQTDYYPRIITAKATERLIGLILSNHVIYGGNYNLNDNYISPTLIEIDINLTQEELMQEEIFGPLLPIISIDNLSEAISFISLRPKPLALYFFGPVSEALHIERNTSSGGMCINDTILQIANHHLPFGGVGNSGWGRYHGFESFRTFSNPRGIYKSLPLLDLKFRYAPYKLPQILKRFL
ncbi:MAG: aldehyde dehydrogenase family protein [Bacteroidales bacterium]